MATGTPTGKAIRKTYTSASSADTTTWAAAPNMADWVEIVGAGTTILVDESTNSITLTTDASQPSRVVPGPWLAFTSTTSGVRVLMGNGQAPPAPAVPASAVPATAGATGGVQLSVAPAVAATPIAVGTNDVRVTTVEIPIVLVLADGAFAESTVWIPGVVGTITGATLSANAAITQSDTNYLTFTLGIRDGAGGSASTVASKSTQVTGGGAFLAFIALTLGAITNATTAAISQVTFKSVKTSAGQAVTGPALLRITYTVP